MTKWIEDFQSWEDVQNAFGPNYKTPLDMPEPDEVLIAAYEGDGYEGDANVLYRNNGKLYFNHGSHCSCYGLENQWDPEEYTVETLMGQIDRANYGFFKRHGDTIRELLK